MPKTAVILFNLGGPDKLESVKPFLFNLFNDRAIINLPQPFRFMLAKLISGIRNPKAKKIYESIGGRSPLLSFTNSQAYALEHELSFSGDFKVFISMRYWNPMACEVIKELKSYAPDQVILLPLYPQFSSATSNSSLEDFASRLPSEIKAKVICCYPSDSSFIAAHTNLIKQKISGQNFSELRFLFSAHGLPQSLIDEGDPYVSHVEKSVAEIVKNFPAEMDFRICYQSKVGPKKWTSPNLEHELSRVVIDKKTPVIVPISFVADNSETLFELDIQYKEFVANLGLEKYLRVSTLNSSGIFIKGLAEICKNAANSNSGNIFCGKNPERICEKKFKFCPNKNYPQA
ncbi:MAG: ferrochelatase [Proteobacteria bacterium]|nr:ferrochelatase [Pseudomonadota bacterium]